MDCKEAENLVSAYINKNMSLHDLRGFLAHIKSCASCYDELQTYYMVYFAMEHLENGGSDPSYNMNTVLLEDLKHRERYVRRQMAKRCILTAGCILSVLFVLFLIVF